MSTTLVAYLETKSPLLLGKYLELRTEVAGWLAYIPQTFPHYTRHTVEHSDKIIEQLSKLLFRDDDHLQPTINLSGVEAYVLLAGALLHDCGMVVSDKTKTQVLGTKEWQEWIAVEGRRERLRAIDQLRASSSPDQVVRNFLADVQLRFLIAEYFRILHHVRSGEVLQQEQSRLGRFALDDPALVRTISDVCVAHGLDRSELNDDVRYPMERDLLGEKINVRLMAILLRIGDLLDLSCDRACPLLLSAASPLPSRSLAHWSQYRRIVHRNTTPEVIEIHAECETQEEHRLLLDWCNWIHDEVDAAPRLLALKRRHGAWKPPEASVASNGSIRIRPAQNANYIPSAWRLEFDTNAILDRLIRGSYRFELAFVRELIQNAVDATRCKMYLDYGQKWPERLTQLPKDFRDRYALQVTLGADVVRNDLSGEEEVFSTLEFDDCGTGMSVEIIEKYFLQVGKSYYRSPEFRRTFEFSPIGRHGIGFLSVFSQSELVTVETCYANRGGGAESTRIILTGPRTYFIREQGSRTTPGTTIRVRLNKVVKRESIEAFVRALCRRIEIPVIVRGDGVETLIEHECPEDFESEVRNIAEEDAVFRVKAMPFETQHLSGELYIFEYDVAGRVSWASWSWANYTYKKSHPLARLPLIPENCVCEGGLDYSADEYALHNLVDTGYREGPISIRLNSFGPKSSGAIDRHDDRLYARHETGRVFLRYPEIEVPVTQVLKDHVADRLSRNVPDEWRYFQQLMRYFPVWEYWRDCPGTCQFHLHGESRSESIRNLKSRTEISVLQSLHYNELLNGDYYSKILEKIAKEEVASSVEVDGVTITRDDILRMNSVCVAEIFSDRILAGIQVVNENILVVHWRSGDKESCSVSSVGSYSVYEAEIPSFGKFGLELVVSGLGGNASRDVFLLNSTHPLTQWIARVRRASASGVVGLAADSLGQIVDHASSLLKYHGRHEVARFREYLLKWRAIPSLLESLMPPDIEEDDFLVR